ncbi:MAG TPA: nucleotide disphospho-sugar-binding domain-containing protein, partial [Lapillicoccus sp.]
FEYPRTDLPSSVSFAGPLLPPSSSAAALPAWWGDLDGRTVVHVTQGTIATDNLDRLIGVTARALAGADLLVVATTGSGSLSTIPHPLPTNLRVADHLPYGELLPRVDVMVTNGGYGGVHFAIANGVPLVVGGATEDKREVGTRVAWSGVGVNLRTQSPSPQAIRAAVHRLTRGQEIRRRVLELQAESARYRPLDIVADALADVCHVSATDRRGGYPGSP